MRVFLAVQGQGIAHLPAFTVGRELAAKQLESVLDEHTQEQATFWLLWPASSHLPPRLRVFIMPCGPAGFLPAVSKARAQC